MNAIFDRFCSWAKFYHNRYLTFPVRVISIRYTQWSLNSNLLSLFLKSGSHFVCFVSWPIAFKIDICRFLLSLKLDFFNIKRHLYSLTPMKNAAYQMILKFYNANRTGLKHEIVFSQWLDIKCFITKCFRKYVFIDQPEYTQLLWSRSFWNNLYLIPLG